MRQTGIHQIFVVISNFIQLFLFEKLIFNKVVIINEHFLEVGLRIVEVGLGMETVRQNLTLIVDSCSEALKLDRPSVSELFISVKSGSLVRF